MRAVGQTTRDINHALTDVMGTTVDGPRSIIIEQFRLADDDVLLLCTNGLTDVVDEDGIANALASRRKQGEQCELLVDRALANGAVDNIAVVLANYHVQRLDSDTARPLTTQVS